jgi:surface antigen
MTEPSDSLRASLERADHRAIYAERIGLRRRSRGSAIGVLFISAILAVGPAVGAAQARASAPHFGAHAATLARGRALSIRLVARSARSCTLVERGPRGRHLRHRYGFTPPVAEFTLKAGAHTAPGEWVLTAICRTARHRSLSATTTRIRVVGTHGSGILGGADTSRWPEASTPQVRPVSGAGFGGGAIPNPFELGQCTWWAFNERPEVYIESVNGGAPKGGWNGGRWAPYAAQYGGFPVGTTPEVGALLSYGAGTNDEPGHVAYVTQVEDSNHFITSEMNTDDANIAAYRVFTRYYWRGTPGNAGSYRYSRQLPSGAKFIYRKPAASAPLQGGSSQTLQGSTQPIQGGGTQQIQNGTGPTGGGGTPPPPPTPPPTTTTPPPPPPPSKSIQIGWSGAHSGWIWMTLNGFSTGSHQYTCSFASGGDATFTLTETASPQTWDNGHTCYDFEHGDTVWVVVEGVSSNTIAVP